MKMSNVRHLLNPSNDMNQKWNRRLTISILISFQCILFAQKETTTLRLNEFIQNIESFHPLAKQANLKLKLGDAQTLKAKGGFDPILQSDWSEKNFDQKLYYRQFHTKLRIPTPLGLDIVSGYENYQGIYLNPESTVKPNGLWHLGLEIDVFQGLIVNERKTTLKIAGEFKKLVRNEQVQQINELLINAIAAYLQWQMYFHVDSVLNENFNLSKIYHDNTVQSFLAGEKTAIDTLEAHILMQDASFTLQKNYMDLIKSRYNVENYLWYDNNPISMLTSTQPESYTYSSLVKTVEKNRFAKSLDENPSIQAYLSKLNIAEIEQRLKIEKLKPKLKLKYNPLLYNTEKGILPSYSIDNMAFGAVFSMPLFLRSERAEVQQSKIKIQEIKLDIDNKRNELSNKISNSEMQMELISSQVTLLNNNIINYKKLLDAENEKFNFGESSVFLLNKRQEKFISTKLKLIETLYKQQTESLNYLFFTNQIGSK